MKIPVLKRKDKYYIQLPSELKEEELTSLELIQLKEGYYLLSTKLNTAQEPKKDANNSSLTNVDDASSTAVKSSILQNVKLKTSQEEKKEITLEEELAVVSRLLFLKFSERTPSRVKKLLTANEKEIFDFLIKKKHIWVFKGKKYSGEGVYNISNKLFALWKEQRSKKPSPSSFLPTLQKDGFMILPNTRDAKSFSEEIKEQMALGKVLGVRGFDERYYVATKSYYIRLRDEILKKVKESLPLSSISDLCNAPVDACRVVLKIMAEEGEAIEKRKEIFSLIE